MPNKLSAILSVYNGAPFVEAAVRSILAQTFTDFQFIVVDDGSTDSTVEIIRQINDPRVELIQLPGNQGVPAARNRGLKAATGDYIAVVDADDLSLPDRFRRQIEFLEQHPQVAVVGSQFWAVDQQGVYLFSSRDIGCAPEGAPANLLRLLRGSISTLHPCSMYRGDLLRSFGYDERLRIAHDYDLGLRLCEAGWEADNLPDCLTVHRDHPGSLTEVFRGADADEHHTAFSEFTGRLTGSAGNGEELKAYAWAFHFGTLPPGLPPLDPVRTNQIFKALLDAYARRHPALLESGVYFDLLGQMLPAASLLARAYLQELLKNLTREAPLFLYGAGRHSAWLLQLCREQGVRVEAVYDDAPAHALLEGVGVRSTDELARLPGGVVLVSSDAHHRAMAASLRRRFPERRFTICDPYEKLSIEPFAKY